MADGRHLKIVKSPYLDEQSSDFNAIWCPTADIKLDDSHMSKNYLFFKIQDGGQRQCRKSFITQPIVRFHRKFVLCMRKKSGMPTKAT